MTDTNDNKIDLTAVATVVGDGVEWDMTVFDRAFREYIEIRSNFQDKVIRQWLIEQGWTPPANDKE